MKIFLGYPSEHRTVAEEVYALLDGRGHNVWFDKRSLVGGDIWDEERRAAQDEADLIIHLCSRELLERKGVVQREIRHTLRLAEDQPFGKLFLIFVKLDDVSLPIEFERFHYIRQHEPGWEEQLLASVTKREMQELPVRPRTGAHVEIVETSKRSRTVEVSEIETNYELRAVYIEYQAPGIYWSLVNSTIAASVLKSFFGFRRHYAPVADLFDDQKSTWESLCSEFYRRGELISVRFSDYYYGSGAAHGNYGVHALNFGGPDFGLLDMPSLISHDLAKAGRMLDYCEKIILANHEMLGRQSERGAPFLSGYRGTESSVWGLVSNFSFDNRGITINFSPYDILPYACGSHEVLIPWDLAREFLSREYRAVVSQVTSE